MSRVAIVTGAARGIGAATTARLAAEGWDVVAVDLGRDDPRLPYALGTAEELRAVADACGARAVVADACSLEELGAVVDEVGELDAFVACAGVVAGGVPHWEMDPERERAVLDVCLGSALLGARLAIPAMLRRPAPRAGRFVAVASVAALRGLPKLAAYCAAKAGVVGLVRSLAVELRGTGVTANAVCPGSTDTPVLEETARLYALEDGAQTFAAQQPIERLIAPVEIAATIAHLVGPDGAAITGSAITVDGGLSV